MAKSVILTFLFLSIARIVGWIFSRSKTGMKSPLSVSSIFRFVTRLEELGIHIGIDSLQVDDIFRVIFHKVEFPKLALTHHHIFYFVDVEPNVHRLFEFPVLQNHSNDFVASEIRHYHFPPSLSCECMSEVSSLCFEFDCLFLLTLSPAHFKFSLRAFL